MRIGLLDDPETDAWTGRPNRFERLALILAGAGHDVSLLGGPAGAGLLPPGVRAVSLRSPALPLLTGLNHALETQPLTRAHAWGRQLADAGFDLVIAPLGGGLAHGLAMARTCGEALAGCRLYLWVDRPARDAYLAGDEATSGLRPLVADALERATLARVDGLIAPDDAAIAALERLGLTLPPVFRAHLPPVAIPSVQSGAPLAAITDLAFIGRLDRASGAVAFLDAVERLQRTGDLGGRTVHLIGPYRRSGFGVGADWLGLRAAGWRFPFRLTEARDPRTAMAGLAMRPGGLAVISSDEGAGLTFDPAALAPHLVLTPAEIRASDFSARLAAALAGGGEAVPAGGGGADPARPDPARPDAARDWPALLADLARQPIYDPGRGPASDPGRGRAPPRDSPLPGVSVLVLHKDRPTLLPHAIASLPRDLGPLAPLEILLIDNGSSTPEALAWLDRLAADRPDIRQLRLPQPLHATAGYNAGAQAARHGTLVFLDDDNAFAPDGVARLARAVVAGRLDVVTSTLEVFDNLAPEPGPGVAELTFIGEAASAGLFFNAFGDTAMAIRRDMMLAIGGFPTEGGASPSFDWVMLSRAAAAGARIGVLQTPAVRYRRDTARAAATWMKYDRENARSRVFEAYAGKFDAELVARFAQKRHIEDL